MNRQDFLNFHQECTRKMFDICTRKNNDYAGGNEDPFRNFRVVGAMDLSVYQGFVTRMSDKLSRLATFTKGKELLVKDESVEDTLLDLANYCILMAGCIRSDKQRSKSNEENQEKICAITVEKEKELQKFIKENGWQKDWAKKENVIGYVVTKENREEIEGYKEALDHKEKTIQAQAREIERLKKKSSKKVTRKKTKRRTRK